MYSQKPAQVSVARLVAWSPSLVLLREKRCEWKISEPDGTMRNAVSGRLGKFGNMIYYVPIALHHLQFSVVVYPYDDAFATTYCFSKKMRLVIIT